jgi:GNAT superfamily N-acetyltransferase
VLLSTAPDRPTSFEDDDAPGTIHVAASDPTVAEELQPPHAIATLLRQQLDLPEGATTTPALATIQLGDTHIRLRGMATHEQLRSRGLGAAALAHGLELAATVGATGAWCNARLPAVGFYERNGWTIVSTQFDIPSIGAHVVMARSLLDLH